MKIHVGRDKIFVLSFFLAVILAGAFLLFIPGVFSGGKLRFIDALFTSTSAVCVTGLITVDTAQYTRFGQIVVMLLIQTGGLGIITFATLYLALPRRKISIMSKGMISDYSLSEVEYQPKVIIRSILSYTFAIEGIGAFFYFFGFIDKPHPLFNSIFHSVSAFCNAGFSTFSNNLEGYVTNPIVNLTTVGLIILGGLGFVVIRDLRKYLRREKLHLAYHSRIVLKTTIFLVLGGTLLFFLLEYRASMNSLTVPQKLLASLFQSVTPRTAGFDTIPQNLFTQGSKLITMLLMFIGASPASTGGGVKTTTFFVLMLAAFRYRDNSESIQYDKRAIGASSVFKAIGIVVKGILIVVVATVVIEISERSSGHTVPILDTMFETISAFGTVGLSQGITSTLNDLSKFVLICTMYVGRVGLFAFALPKTRSDVGGYAELPGVDVLLS